MIPSAAAFKVQTSRVLVSALEPHIGGDMPIKRRLRLWRCSCKQSRNPELARDPDFAAHQGSEGERCARGGPVALSLQALVERSQARASVCILSRGEPAVAVVGGVLAGCGPP